MSEYQGDIAAAATIYWLFPSTVNGVPTNLAGSPACSVYKNNTTESTSGVTLTAPYDSVVGMNQIKVDTSSDGTFYAAGNNFDVVITTGTLGGTSVVGQTVGSFSIQNRYNAAPTAAAIATAIWQDATAGDFTVASSIGKSLYTSGVVPGGANGLFIAGTNAATTITTALTTTFTGNLTGSVGSVTGAVGSVTGNVGGNVVGSVASVTGNVGGNLVGNVNGNVVGSVASVTGNVGGNVVGSVASVTGNVGGNVVGSVGSVTGNVGGNLVGNVNGNVVGSVASVTGNVGGNVTGSVGSLAAQAKADVNAEVVDVLTVDTFAQPGQETPAATQSILKALQYLYKAWRNKSTQTDTRYQVYNDDAATVDQAATTADDNITFTRGEVSSGP